MTAPAGAGEPMDDAMPRGEGPRVVTLAGATNFRDLGGYAGHQGRRLRWRRLFRSDHLGALTEADRAVLADLGVRTSCDFRGAEERAAAPYAVPGLAQHSLAIEPTVARQMQAHLDAGRRLTVGVVEGLMRDLYRNLVGERTGRFGEFFDHLLRADAPLVFHCTAGKDRTGVAAALVLVALGVSRETVMTDYLLSNEFFKPPWTPREDIDPAVLQALWTVQRSYLEAALETIERSPGGRARFLRERLGLTAERQQALAQRYLAPA